MENLSSYLNDHLAGSVGALELLDRLVETYEGKPLAVFFAGLRNDIHEDQEKLRELIQAVGAEESAVRKAGAWLMEKLSRAKMPVSESSEDEMGLFLALEALALGIMGKRSLWQALQVASPEIPQLARLDYAGLEKRATEQHERVEAKRLEIARSVLKDT
ncbi:MAG TPA: hypothetical protein VJU77_11395 [Chthoniobacterales bacterium]|nr:hypothetical protein [Chthoniobacterales bacterium]